MNRNLRLATAIGLAATAGVGTASAQLISPVDLVFDCIDPTVTDPKPYSDDYGHFGLLNNLFGVEIGISGTVNYSKICFPPSGITIPVSGRIGFFTGGQGSVQDTAYGGPVIDDFMTYTMGAPFGVAGNWGGGVVVRQAVNNGAVTRVGFGTAGLDEYLVGASDRYFLVGSTVNAVRVTLRADVLGDSCRLQWDLNNQGAAGSIGFDFGQWVVLGSQFSGYFAAQHIDVPGYRPLTTDHRFARNPGQITALPQVSVYPMPPYANFGIDRAHAFGLSLPMQADPTIPDQTPVDILDIGKVGAGWLLGPVGGAGIDMPAYDKNNPPPLLDDTEFIGANSGFGGTAYVQRWLPVATNVGASRVINAYYRTTWGVSDYDRPYSAVVDTPKVVAVDANDPRTFLPNPMVVRVYVDNTRGFSTVDAPVPLNDVRVTLNLPQGMSDAADATHTKVKIVKTINRVDPKQMNFVDFQVYVDPTTFGIQQYNVKIEPNPGPVKTISGTINVATQPYLLIRPSANLVTAPWNFAGGNNWGSILGSDPDFKPDINYQAYEWDAAQQAYVVQVGPRRGFGTWLISDKNKDYRPLQSSPTPPPDLATGADLILLRPGWNLIGNPYQYSIPIGQIVGVSAADPRSSQSFQTLAESNIINASLAFWDQDTQSYRFTSGYADLLVPNRGYWIYVNSPSNLTLSFPPVTAAFVPVQPGEDVFPFKPKWNLRMSVKTATAADDQNVIGATEDAAQAAKASQMKPPIAPLPTAVYGSFVQVKGSKTLQYATSYQPNASHQEWAWQVTTRQAGPTSVSWPTNGLPAGLKLTLTDLETGRAYNMRQVGSISYLAKAQSVHKFKVTADSTFVAPAPMLGSVTAERVGRGSTAPVGINYQLSTATTTTVRVLSGAKVVAVLKNNVKDAAGTQTVQWNLKDSTGRTAARGNYGIEVTVSASGRSTETKTVYTFIY